MSNGPPPSQSQSQSGNPSFRGYGPRGRGRGGRGGSGPQQQQDISVSYNNGYSHRGGGGGGGGGGGSVAPPNQNSMAAPMSMPMSAPMGGFGKSRSFRGGSHSFQSGHSHSHSHSQSPPNATQIPHQNTHSHSQSPSVPRGGFVQLEVSGYPDDVKHDELMNFLSSNANFRPVLQFRPIRCRVQCSQHEVESLLALNGKPIRPNFPLLIEVSASGRPLHPNEKETLRNFMKSHFDAENKFIDLSAFNTKCAGMHRIDFHNKNFVQEIGIIIKETLINVTTISFASNGISSLNAFSRLHQFAPQLINFSFASNQISTIEQLDFLSGFRDSMREIILMGNPLESTFPQVLEYHHSVSALFPNLQMLDRQQIVQLISFDLPPIVSLSALPPPKGSFFLNESAQNLYFAFIKQYFDLYDSDRSKLTHVYDENAMFSLSAASDIRFALIPPAYQEINRNLLQIGSRSRSQISSQLLKVRQAFITVTLAQLPPTRHDFESLVGDAMFIPELPGSSASTSPSQSQVFISVKGKFLETDLLTVRHFHRTFICKPPTDTSKLHKWNVTIVHDQLFVGGGKQLSDAEAAAVTGAPAPLNPSDQQRLNEVIAVTGVSAEVAFEALKVNMGSVEGAVSAIREKQQIM